MGHNICAIVGRKPINEEKLKKYQLALAYEGDYAIIILEQDSIYYWGDKLNLSFHSASENIEWACEVTFHFAREVGLKIYGIIQTDYFAGLGEQCASLYEDGKVIIAERSIDDILCALGVIKTDSKDEFDTLNLGDYRHSEYYYWDTNNFAEIKGNMIAGRVPKEGL